MTAKEKPLAVGDRVSWRTRSGHFSSAEWRGVVTRVTAGGGVVVVQDHSDREQVFRANSRIKPTRLTEYDLAGEAWIREAPKATTGLASLSRSAFGRDELDFRVHVEWPRDRAPLPDEVEVVGSYLQAVAAWLRRRPVRE